MFHYLVFGALAVLNIISFIMFCDDKRRAMNGDWRISEAALLTVAAVGGSLGATLGMIFLRHKTRHKIFAIGLPILLVIHLVLLVIFIPRLAAL